MMNPWWLMLAVTAVLGGCQCQCVNGGVVGGNKDAGVDGGTGGGGGGGGGGAQDAGVPSTGFGSGSGTGLSLDGGPGGQGTGLQLNPDSGISLARGGQEFYFMWIANNAQGWVSKYDTRTAREVGRYFSVIPKDCSSSPLGPPCAGGQAHGLRADVPHFPSRTAIDLNGDVWVANRAMNSEGSVTKIANAPTECIDRNGNGRIDTSRDVNGDGSISERAADGEMIVPTNFADVNQYDECVLFTQPLGGPVPAASVGARAIAISASFESGAGDVWVGIFHSRRLYKLSTVNGAVKPVNAAGDTSVELGFGPYGAIVDRQQRLWVVEAASGRLAQIDTNTGTLVSDTIKAPAAQRCGSYGIAIDGKNRVWLPGWSQGARACRYDPATSQWQDFDFTSVRTTIGTAFTFGRGIAVDTSGVVYMSGTGTNTSGAWAMAAQLMRFDAETGAIIPFGAEPFIDATSATANGSIGVGLDADGHPWVNNSSGNAMKVDKATGAVTFTPQQPAGLYTYSDFTGYQLRNYTAPRGVYTNTLTGCSTSTEWYTLSWSALVPPRTSVTARVRAANTVGALDTATPFTFTASPADLRAAGVPKALYLRVEFTLASSDGVSSPVLRGYNVEWDCSGIN